jgi:uncharacterized protein YidB (DUF937 family)
MGLLDNLIGTVTGGAGKNQNVIGGIVELLNSPQVGGLQGLTGKFKQAGLNDVVDSWIGTGKNKAITASLITKVLGSEVVAKYASKLGISPAAASTQLAKYLPMVIDKLSPDGKLPSLDKLGDLTGLLGKFLK